MSLTRIMLDPNDPNTPPPRTLAAQRPVIGGGIRVSATQFPLSHIGIAWQGSQAHVRIQTAAGWSDWKTVTGCSAGRDGREATSGAVVVAPGAVSYELAIDGSGVGEVTELNTAEGPAVAAAAAVTTPTIGMPLPDGTWCPVNYVTRAGWGADESLRFNNKNEELWPPEYYPVQSLTVHHSAGVNNDPNPAATVRAIYFFQCVTEAWGDIGYHLLIDEAGRVYEGRVSGGSIPVFQGVVNAGQPPQMNTGAHILGYNTGNIGVCLLGDMTSVWPTPVTQAALATVLAGLARTNGLNPFGTVNYFNPVNNNTANVNTISGHRNWAATQCPGNTFYPTLPRIRTMTYGQTRGIPPRRRVGSAG